MTTKAQTKISLTLILSQISMILFLGAYSDASYAQSKPLDFVLGTLPTSTPYEEYSILGYGPNSGTNYYTSRTYHLKFGQVNSSTPGFNRIVKLFSIEGETYSLTKAVPGTLPFLKVNVNRYGVAPDVKTTALFEVPVQPSNLTDSDMYLTPDYVDDMGALINSYIINRGTDNVFVRNSSSSTSNNITRIDLILEDPVVIPATLDDRKKSGFLLLERGGNDNFRVAGITGVSMADTTISALGSVVPVSSSTWGSTGQTILSVVMQKSGADIQLRPSQFINSQAISGIFVSLESLGIAPGTTIYGISVMGNNVTDPFSFSSTTSESDGGLDFMAGGGFFTRAFLISGQVWVDADGDAISDAGEIGISNGLWANLVDNTGRVISSVPLNPDGTYSVFIAQNNVLPGMEYSVILTNEEHFEDDILSSSDTLANDYQYTGTNYEGVGDVTNTTGIIEIGEITDDIIDVNFGLNTPPVADPKNYAVDNSAFSHIPPVGFDPYPGYHSIPMSSSDLIGYPTGGSLSGSDAEDCVALSSCHSGSTFSIETINSNTRIFYDFGGMTGVVEIDVTSGPVTIPGFDPTKLVIYGEHDGSGTIADPFGFTYSLIDEAGVKSQPVDYTISTPTPLAIELLHFNAQTDGFEVVLKWATASENNHSAFEIERSIDSRNWNKIGLVSSLSEHGNSHTTLEYDFTDETPISGYNFYRLKLIDLDGNNSYSDVKFVEFYQKKNINIYPNPVTNSVHIEGLSGNEWIEIYDILGQKIISTQNSDSTQTIDLSRLNSGLFILVIEDTTKKKNSYRLIKK